VVGFEITGLQELQRKLEDAQRALAAIDGEIGQIRFNPNDPASIEATIRNIEATIDSKVAPYGNNEIVKTFVNGVKEKYRAKILEIAKTKAEA
jgi:hypothetical protein